MKKITAILIAVIMIVCIFAGTTSAFKDNVMPEGFKWISNDWYAYAGAFVSQAGLCEELVMNNPPEYVLHDGVPALDVVGFYGWAAFTEEDKLIKTFGYKFDGGEMINSPLSREQEGLPDRRQEIKDNAGVPNGEGFWLIFSYTDLKVGKHNVAFYAIGTDGTTREMFNYDFKVVADGEWLCGINASASLNTGWWFNPVNPQPDDRYVNVEFTAKKSFNGIRGFYWCNDLDAAHGVANMTVELIKDGKTVASGKAIGNANSWVDTDFGKTFEPGKYTLKYTCLDGAGEGKSWFVIGSSTVGSGDTVVTGNVNVTENMVYPAIMLKTVEKASNPSTADAAVIAIAAVACVALAGIVVAKKIK